jgi:putative PIG3 family NAD(P)H quinone oxidoreductase
MPETMTAIEIEKPGAPEVLKPATRPRPVPAGGEVLIKVAAAGVNRPDVLQRQGGYPPPPGVTDILGLEVAGAVAALGEGVTSWKVGDQVCALVIGGGYAEYAPAPAVQCLPVPKGLSLIEAAGIPETFFTVWTNVFERGRLKAGETLLVHGGASGIGTTAIQVANRLGATVLATAGSPEKCQACVKLGAARAINYKAEDFVAVVKDFTGGKGVDVILDMVGGDYIERNIRSLATEGRLVSIGFQKGSKAEVNFMPVMLKRLTIAGSTLRIQPVERKGQIARALRENIWPLIEKGLIKPVIHATFPLGQAARAHALMEADTHVGKIILTV